MSERQREPSRPRGRPHAAAPTAARRALRARVDAVSHPAAIGPSPAPRPGLIGREQELRTARRLLGASRLVTLVGAGGVGKTRLALAAAEATRAEFAHGVAAVDLAPLADHGLVLGAVARAFGLREVGGLPLAARLEAHLRGRRALLVLDNCEHLLDACAALAA